MGVSTQEIRGLVGAVGRDVGLRDPYGSQGYYPSNHTASTSSTTTSHDPYGRRGYYPRDTTVSTTASSQDPIYCDPLAKVSLNIRFFI